MEAIPVNGETVIRGQRNIFGTAPVLLAVVPVLMTARAAPSFGLAERAAELLAGSAIVGGLSVLVHGESGIAKKITCGHLLRVLCSPLIQRNHSIACVIELLETGSSYDAATLSAEYTAVDPSMIQVADIVEGVTAVDDCMTAVGKIPDTLLAPGWSHNTVVAAVMATKTDRNIMGLFGGKAIIDADCSENGVTEYSELANYKSKNNFVDPNQIVCWPMVKIGDYQFHTSTQLAGLMSKVDTDNRGVPYESPSNKGLKMDTCCLEDGTEVNLSWPQIEIITGDYGIVTALNFMNMGWVAKGNYTACYPANTDVKDFFIPLSRMFDWVGNTLIRTFWSKLDKPMNRRLIDNILDTCNIWLNGLVGMEYLLGARAEMLESENPLLDLMAGILRIHIYITPPSPMQLCEFTLEYDISYVQTALAA